MFSVGLFFFNQVALSAKRYDGDLKQPRDLESSFRTPLCYNSYLIVSKPCLIMTYCDLLSNSIIITLLSVMKLLVVFKYIVEIEVSHYILSITRLIGIIDVLEFTKL